MSGPCFQLLYTSVATPDTTRATVLDILAVSRRNNRMRNITGLLLFRSGRFLQLLEGEEESVRAVYKKIRGDDRHYSCRELIAQSSQTRIFPAWSMGQVDERLVPSRLEKLWPRIESEIAADNSTSQKIMSILKTFNASMISGD